MFRAEISHKGRERMPPQMNGMAGIIDQDQAATEKLLRRVSLITSTPCLKVWSRNHPPPNR